jgi:hypothetical protein
MAHDRQDCVHKRDIRLGSGQTRRTRRDRVQQKQAILSERKIPLAFDGKHMQGPARLQYELGTVHQVPRTRRLSSSVAKRAKAEKNGLPADVLFLPDACWFFTPDFRKKSGLGGRAGVFSALFISMEIPYFSCYNKNGRNI